MPHWMIKSAIHRAISLLPRSDRWNELFQHCVTRSLELPPGALSCVWVFAAATWNTL